MKPTAERLIQLRNNLKQKGIGAYIIPLSDPHLEENIPEHWQIVEWLTGFTGSYAIVIVTDSAGWVWTDSRYFIQAERELADTDFRLEKPDAGNNYDYLNFLEANIDRGSKIGLDGRLFSINQLRKLQKKLERKNISIDIECDPISDLWTERPLPSSSPAFDHPVEFNGKGRDIKIADVRALMKGNNVNCHLLTSPDDIMWLLNLRGNDLKYSPLVCSFALVCEEQVLIFIDEQKIPFKLASGFDKLGIVILPYEETGNILSSVTEQSKVLINPDTTSVALYNSISVNAEIIEDLTIPSRLKAIKNKIEIENIGKSMVSDGIALTKFLFWFENNLGKMPMTEVILSGKILEFRSQQDDFIGPSFSTIAAFGEHSALPHYSPDDLSDPEIGEDGILLIDSGGQYMYGTTDITRTIPTGVPTGHQKKDFTLVLKGHINLALAKFPFGTKGYQLDILARNYLWNAGLNYGHGTGHGVGFCLNVHEGPQSISPADNKCIIEPGMLISNEPGVYREGEYGIRIENLILCYEDEETEFGKFLKFDTVSLCYIDKTLIDRSLLDLKEITWINNYHSEVYEKLSPGLTLEEKLWLKEKTEPV